MNNSGWPTHRWAQVEKEDGDTKNDRECVKVVIHFKNDRTPKSSTAMQQNRRQIIGKIILMIWKSCQTVSEWRVDIIGIL